MKLAAVFVITALSTVLLIVLGTASLRLPVMRDYNRVYFEVNITWLQVQDNYLFTSNDGQFLTRKHLFIGVATEECFDDLFQPALLGVQRHCGRDIAEVLLLQLDQAPFSSLHQQQDQDEKHCAEVLFVAEGSRLEDAEATYDLSHSVLNEFVRDMTRVESLSITNHFNHPIDFYWHDESKTPLYQGHIKPGETVRLSTFLGHVFSANDPSQTANNKEYALQHPEYSLPGNVGILDYFVVSKNQYFFDPKNRLEVCELAESLMPLFSDQVSCDNPDLFLRFMEFAQSVFHEKRIGLNFVQPHVVRAVTEDGFRHMKLPAETFQWLKSWYLAEQLKKEEIESTAGPCMNQHVAPSTMTHITPDLKERFREEVQPILEAWYAEGPLQLTSIYGIRKYVNGSVLRMHVDTANTHVVSAIINVDQRVNTDWPLLILDHEENEHNLIMQPGDMVLYESAKLLHGRPEMFDGEHYDNIFIHFQPVSEWDYDWL